MKTVKNFTDRVNECECCGKQDLKGTYLLVDEFNNEFYYGSTCAFKKHGANKKELANANFKFEASKSCVYAFARRNKLGVLSFETFNDMLDYCIKNNGLMNYKK
jgi:hypothetical protein